jgi:hypothetical protein
MSRSNDKLSIPSVVVIGAVAVIAIIASGVLRGTPASGAEPTPPPAASPSVPASPSAPAKPAPTPIPSPVDDFSDGSKDVKLDIADEHDVHVEVKDFIGTVADATTGHGGDGMSVRWYDLKVENVDDDTLRLTWVGYPTDDPVKLIVARLDGKPDGKATIVLFQHMPPENSDALGFDRVLDLHFESPVSADDFAVATQDGWDTGD